MVGDGLDCFPEEEGGPSGLIRAFVLKAVESIPFAGENLAFAYELMEQAEAITEKTASTNQCMEQFITRTINKAIASNVRRTLAAEQRAYLTASNSFRSFVSDKTFNISTMREGARSRFKEMSRPLGHLFSWYTLCSAEDTGVTSCVEDKQHIHSQFFADFAVFASSQFLPFHLTRYVQYYPMNGFVPPAMADDRKAIATTIIREFSKADGIYQVCISAPCFRFIISTLCG